MAIIGQIGTGIAEEINAKQLAWGIQNEDAAFSAYEMFTGEPVEQVPFIYKDPSRRFGCSPDGILKNKEKGLELKCPFATSTHVEYITSGKIKPAWYKQVQFSMWITDFETWDKVSFDPRMKKGIIHIQTIERDEKIMKDLDKMMPLFVKEMDEKLAIVGLKFGEQWGKDYGTWK